jgi:hypothetical protein
LARLLSDLPPLGAWLADAWCGALGEGAAVFTADSPDVDEMDYAKAVCCQAPVSSYVRGSGCAAEATQSPGDVRSASKRASRQKRTGLPLIYMPGWRIRRCASGCLFVTAACAGQNCWVSA